LQYLYIYIPISLYGHTMPSIQIYLDQKLFEFVKKDKSKIIQQALKQYIEEQELKKRDTSTLPA